MGKTVRFRPRITGNIWSFLLAGFAALSASLARADLAFQQPLVNAGEVRAGAPLAHQFQFINQGPEAVEITGARASCGCLTPRVDRRAYQPGERGCVHLDVNTLSQASGPHTWRVYLSYRCGAEVHEVPLQLSAQVVTEVLVTPASMTVFADNAVTHEIFVTDLRPRGLKIAAVRTSSPKLRPRLVGNYRDAFGHEVRKIQVELANDYPDGRHDEVLDIVTDDASYRDLRVPVTVVKRSRQRLSVLPLQVTMLAAPGQEVPSRLLRVQDNQHQEVVISGVSADHPAIVCQWCRGPGAAATVKINVDRRRVPGKALDAALQITIAQPVPHTFTVPVHCDLP